MVEFLMVSVLSDNEIDVVAGGRHGEGGGRHGGGGHAAETNISITVIQIANGGIGGGFTVIGGTLTNVGNTGNSSVITITF